MLADLLTMTSGRVENQRNGVLVDIKDPGAGTHAITLGQSLEHTINGLLIGVETREDTVVARRKFSAAFHKTIESSLVRTIVADQLEIILNGFALVGATQDR
jgi:hypothetical protein